jgi:hypothetical protein
MTSSKAKYFKSHILLKRGKKEEEKREWEIGKV